MRARQLKSFCLEKQTIQLVTAQIETIGRQDFSIIIFTNSNIEFPFFNARCELMILYRRNPDCDLSAEALAIAQSNMETCEIKNMSFLI